MNKFRISFYSMGLLISLLGMVSCTDDNPQIEEKNDNIFLVSAVEKYLMPESLIEQSFDLPGIEDAITNGILISKIVYKTTYNNVEIEASGTIALPDKPGEYPLALVQRGTILENRAAPSESILPSYEAFSGMGYIVFVPDLIGYGASKDILHPYFDYSYTAKASVDMYRAVLEFMDDYTDSTVNWDQHFFITGYSQGGYSAMATYKYISENINDINITAVGTGAGGYDIMSIVQNILREETYPASILLVMPLVTYNELYVKGPLTDIFNSPYDAMIQEVINGDKEWVDIAGELPEVIAELFNASLIEGLKTGASTPLSQAIVNNSVHDWAPALPTVLYHYPPDEIIPVETTYTTLEQMKINGAVDIRSVEIPAEMVPQSSSAHSAAGIPALQLAFMEFNTYRLDITIYAGL